MHTLDGRQKKALHAALLSAFPRQPALERLVEFHLDAHLAAVAGEGPLNDVVFRLIEWAEAHGRVEALVAGAREVNPRNADLVEFERLAREAPPPSHALPARRLSATAMGSRRGCTVMITLVVVAAFAVPLLWDRQGPLGGDAAAPDVSQSAPDDVGSGAMPSAAPGRRVEVDVPFTWRSGGEDEACRSDAEWRRAIYVGESAGVWPPDGPESREVQLVSLRDGVEIEHAQVFTADGIVAQVVSTTDPRSLLRRWRMPSPVAVPLRIAVCLRARSAAPQPALRVATGTRTGG